MGAVSVFAGTLQEGRTAFAKGDYAGAVKLYEQALAGTQPSAGAYYDYGQALLKSGMTAAAALNFHRSLMLDPQSSQTRDALSEANMVLGIPEDSLTWYKRAAMLFSPDTLVIGGNALGWIGGFLLIGSIFKTGQRKRLVILSALLLVLGGGTLIVGCLSDPRIIDRSQAIVMADKGAAVLAAPVDHSDTVAQLPEGSPVWVLSERGRWSYCRLADGATGWMASSAVSPVIPKT